ncbi:hypothetical protein BLA29_009006 [Euroglyphus maynei]|uniref:Uncharacterized protein n=1 Tax=Euroglyphus maynei TaxID=6958 RepID=A0A1Y3BRJ2_EURMA|nr:hypothetical protein BLA29_009006 [Euroglyphus maynei]
MNRIPKLEKSTDPLVKNGLQYVYYASPTSSTVWTIGQRSLNDSRSILGATLKPILKNNHQNYNQIWYNDQKPTKRTRSTSTGAHAKGVIVFDGKTGYWLLHSIPQFPSDDSDQSYEYPKRSLNNDRIFIG